MKDSIEKLPSVIRDKCGTLSGYQKHTRSNEVTCEPCRKANWERTKANLLANHDKIIKRNKEIYDANPERMKAHRLKYYTTHRDDRIAYSCRYIREHSEEYKAWLAAHNSKPEVKEKARARSAKHRAENKDRVNEISRKSSARHPDTGRRTSSRRRARKRSNPADFYTEKQVIELYGTDCYLCDKAIDMLANRRCGKSGWQMSFWIEHVIPIVAGGSDTLENVRPSHGLCNLQKGKFPPREMTEAYHAQ